MPPSYIDMQGALEHFAADEKVFGKGALAVMLVLTRKAAPLGFPLRPEQFLTKGQGQVAGMGKSATQKILKDHGINRILATEAGRTSRGNMGRMKAYVDFLNGLHKQEMADMESIESFWVHKIEEFFASAPFKLKLDPAKSLRVFVRDLIEQAHKRQKETPGLKYAGAVLQYLVGAKLELSLPEYGLEHHGFSVADGPTNRPGDFLINDVAIHVTTAPTDMLMRKCRENIDNGLKPLIITTIQGSGGADAAAREAGLEDRIDVFEIEQFVATNIYELSGFAPERRKITISELVDKYNVIIEQCETDHSLKIKMQ